MISDTGKAENQRISPEVWEAQQQEIVRLCQAVQAAEKENQALRAEAEGLKSRLHVLEVLYRDQEDLEKIVGGLGRNWLDVRNTVQLIGMVEKNKEECPEDPDSLGRSDYVQLLRKFTAVCHENNTLRSKWQRMRIRYRELEQKRKQSAENHSYRYDDKSAPRVEVSVSEVK